MRNPKNTGRIGCAGVTENFELNTVLLVGSIGGADVGVA